MRIGSLTAAAAALVTFALPTSAHHSFSAEFDVEKAGDARRRGGDDGMGEPALVATHRRAASPTAPSSNGKWRADRPPCCCAAVGRANSLPAGTKVTVEGFAAKDGSFRANARALQFPDGRELELAGTSLPD